MGIILHRVCPLCTVRYRIAHPFVQHIHNNVFHNIEMLNKYESYNNYIFYKKRQQFSFYWFAGLP